MKKFLFTLTLMLIAGLSYSQTTYYWVGGTAATSYTSNSNWNTQLDGLGTSRSVAASNDILVFDGTNVGGTIPTTGQVTTTASSTNSGRLVLQNNANIIIGRASAGSAVITINGDGTSAEDLQVNAGCTLTLGMAIYNYDVQVVMGAGATGLVNGTVYLSPLSNTVHTRSFITVVTANSFVFNTGSAVHITDSLASSGFNASAIGSINFKTGASLYYYTGRSPMGSSSTIQFLNLDPGSNVYFMNSNVSYLDGITSYTSSAWSNLKTYSNIFVKNGATFKSDGPFYKIEDLTIDNACTFITHTSGNTPVLGNLTVNGTLNGPLNSTNTVIMGGNNLQTISGIGTIDVPSLTIANYSDVVLAKSVNVLNNVNVVGKINFGAANKVTGSASFTSRVNGTAANLTGNTVAGSYQITNIVGTITGVTGLAVVGSSLSANTNVVGFSASNALINLSKPALATATGVSFTFMSDTATLVTANPNGMDTLTGSVVVTDIKSFQSGTNY
ncbi:MAG: hypothetical protein ABIW38_12440, partial [Ferruginibacter sp.]